MNEEDAYLKWENARKNAADVYANSKQTYETYDERGGDVYSHTQTKASHQDVVKASQLERDAWNELQEVRRQKSEWEAGREEREAEREKLEQSRKEMELQKAESEKSFHRDRRRLAFLGLQAEYKKLSFTTRVLGRITGKTKIYHQTKKEVKKEQKGKEVRKPKGFTKEEMDFLVEIRKGQTAFQEKDKKIREDLYERKGLSLTERMKKERERDLNDFMNGLSSPSKLRSQQSREQNANGGRSL